MNNPSIFNEVMGPAMRGPSSSHTAASWRIARVCLDILNEPLQKALIEFDQKGAWAANFREQGTAMGIHGGLLGLDILDDAMKRTEELAIEKGIDIRYGISLFPTRHTNTVRLTLDGKNGKRVQILAASTGGGAFEIQQIGDFPVHIRGDYFETLIWTKAHSSDAELIRKHISGDVLLLQSSNRKQTLLNMKSSRPLTQERIKELQTQTVADETLVIHPIMPVLSGNERALPFHTIDSLLEYAGNHKRDLGEMGILYETYRSGLTETTLIEKMKALITIIDTSIKTGLKGTQYEDRLLHQQAHLIDRAEKDGTILKDTIVNKIIAYVTAIMEAKSAMEVIVANPTTGSCGTVGGTLKAVAENLNASPDDIIKAYFASSMIGIFFAQGPGFSAEEHGCQVECGAASGMAAAGIVQLMGGTAKEAIDAASLALQNMIGLICDPVADRVEVPCLGKNISAGMNALATATMIRSGFDAVIPLEEVIQTVAAVGAQMPACVKCTGKGGLSVTNTSLHIKEQMKSNSS